MLRPPTGSVFARAIRLWTFGLTKRWRARQEPQSSEVGFWDAVKPSTLDRSGQQKPSWMSFDDQWVDEVRRGFKACRVFLWFPLLSAYAPLLLS